MPIWNEPFLLDTDTEGSVSNLIVPLIVPKYRHVVAIDAELSRLQSSRRGILVVVLSKRMSTRTGRKSAKLRKVPFKYAELSELMINATSSDLKYSTHPLDVSRYRP